MNGPGGIAVVGNVARDVVDGGEPGPGGCPVFAARALRLLGRDGLLVTRWAPRDDALFEPALAGPGLRVVRLPATESSAFTLDYAGAERVVRVEALGSVWSAPDARVVDRSVGWVHAAPLLRSDVPAAALAALARGRRLSLDGQGLVRVPEIGPLRVDADFDPALLGGVTALKLSEEEAVVVAGGEFDERAAVRLGVPEILVTRGARGVTVHAGGGVVDVPVERAVEGVQTTGAGDAFMVGYAVARLDGDGPVAAARAGCRLAGALLAERCSSSS